VLKTSVVREQSICACKLVFNDVRLTEFNGL